MISNKELETGLKVMAEDFHLLGGSRKKLSRLVAEHMWWFDAAERRGMSWRDMIQAMAAAGVTGRGAKPVSVGTLSSSVWRARTKAAEEADSPRPEGRPEPKPSEPPGQQRRIAKRQPALETQQGGQRASRQNDDARPARPALKQPAGGGRPSSINRGVLAYMDRARAVRRRSKDD